jgi:DcuC family C4-dicarboxylate transporter
MESSSLPFLQLGVAGVIVAGTVCLLIRQVEVRLVLLAAGLLMATFAGNPLAIFDTFGQGMVANLVAPICAAMGFAAVLNATQCDRHLVQLLLVPLRRVPWLLLPGGIIAAYIVNVAVPSQAAAAAAIGPILVPLMMAAGIRAEVAGAALLLGASFGGDLLNPGDQNIQAIVGATGVSAAELTARLLPAGCAGVVVAALVFTFLKWRAQAPADSVSELAGEATAGAEQAPKDLPLNLLKAIVPLVPIGLLLLAYSGWEPLTWLLERPQGPDSASVNGCYPVVRAMLIGTLLAAIVSWREAAEIPAKLFDGMGSGYSKIISMIISAQCFGAGLTALGVCRSIMALLDSIPSGMTWLSIGFPWGLAMLSGSGSGPIFTFAESFLKHVDSSQDTSLLGAVTCLAGSFGRTMSPVAPVVIYCSVLVGASPITLIRNHLPALLAGAGVALAVVLFSS